MDEDSRSSGIRFARGRGLLLGSGVRLTARYHGHIVSDKSDEGQHTSLLVEMGNHNSLIDGHI